MEAIPGFYYDEESGRYFRKPPRRLAYMTNTHPAPPSRKTLRNIASHQSSTCQSTTSPHHNTPLHLHVNHAHRQLLLGQTTVAIPKSVFGLLSSAPLSLDPLLALAPALPRALLSSSRQLEHGVSLSRPNISLLHNATPHLGTPRKVRDVTVNRGGDIVVCAMRAPVGSVVFFASEIVFTKPEKKVVIRPISPTIETGPGYSMFGRDIDIVSCGETESHVVMHYFTSPTSSYVIVKTYRRREDVAFSQASLPTRSYETEEARWPSELDGQLHIDALCCTPSLSKGLIGAVSTQKGVVKVLRLLNASSVTTTHTRKTPDKSSALSLGFCEQASLVYAGTRSGTVVAWDLRSRSCVSSDALSTGRPNGMKPSVIQVHPLGDHYFIANCMDSKLLLWDCRMHRQVLSYPSHINSFRSCRSVVDTAQSFVAAVGEDQTIRVWSLWRGTLLRNILPAEYSRKLLDGELPAITYSNCLGGPRGYPALLVGTHEGLTPFTM